MQFLIRPNVKTDNQSFRIVKSFKICLQRQNGLAILPNNAISIKNSSANRHRFEMEILFQIYAPLTKLPRATSRKHMYPIIFIFKKVDYPNAKSDTRVNRSEIYLNFYCVAENNIWHFLI